MCWVLLEIRPLILRTWCTMLKHHVHSLTSPLVLYGMHNFPGFRPKCCKYNSNLWDACPHKINGYCTWCRGRNLNFTPGASKIMFDTGPFTAFVLKWLNIEYTSNNQHFPLHVLFCLNRMQCKLNNFLVKYPVPIIIGF